MDIPEPYQQLIPLYKKLETSLSVINVGNSAYDESCLKCSEVSKKLKYLDSFLELTDSLKSVVPKGQSTTAERDFFLECYDRTSKDFPVLSPAEPKHKIEDLIKNVLLHGPDIKEQMEMELEHCQEKVKNNLKVIEVAKVKAATNLDKYAREFSLFVDSHVKFIDKLSSNINRTR
ncbi:uncharacterized protein LOC122857047 [Aphidius gifuensis]|uniref:uncharacterized protein LOC122857047 n=1 Tax=Aphidius gifuensis TaxID=684658 RepID=UPI001CDC9C50|nr:uncharacterized protein LOC122857047 [Aphidius gifuensis]